MATNVTVRPAAEEDVDGIQAMARAAWHETYDDLLGRETVDEFLAEGYDADVLRALVEREEVGLFVAADDGTVVGCATCGKVDPAGVGDMDLYAHPDYWGTGVGERLLERGLDFLAERGVQRVRDEVLADNEVGNAFYRKHFERVGDRETELGGEARRVNVYEREVDAARATGGE
ncbi:MAG: N-acetyltransferase family protein [Haloarculaceae archaeon]